MIVEQIWTGNAYRNFNYLIACGETGEALAIEVGISIPSARLIRTLRRLIDWYGAPDSIRMDNGPEMTSHEFTEWAANRLDGLGCVSS